MLCEAGLTGHALAGGFMLAGMFLIALQVG